MNREDKCGCLWGIVSLVLLPLYAAEELYWILRRRTPTDIHSESWCTYDPEERHSETYEDGVTINK